jgi:hypothetical protein
MRKRLLAFAPLFVLAFLGFIALGGYIVMSLWNWLLPPLFAWSPITFWQALGLLALCRILFGGFGRHGSGGSTFRRRVHERWDQRSRERWESLTPEERERLRHRLGGRCGFGPPDHDRPEPADPSPPPAG